MDELSEHRHEGGSRIEATTVATDTERSTGAFCHNGDRPRTQDSLVNNIELPMMDMNLN